jgi:hypothetical protein
MIESQFRRVIDQPEKRSKYHENLLNQEGKENKKTCSRHHIHDFEQTKKDENHHR